MTQPAASSTSAAALTLPVTVDTLAAEMVALFAIAEEQLLTDLAHTVGQRNTALLAALRREALRVATELRLRATPLAQQIAQTAATRGTAAATLQLRRLITGSPRIASLLLRTPSASVTATAIGLDLAAKLDATLPGILRFADDAYRAAQITAALTTLRDTGTPALGQQAAWRHLSERGISGFTDKSGRQWGLASYVEMATRTAVQRAYNAAHLDRMTAVGIEQFTVPDDGHPCPLCKPWQGRILTLHGPDPTIEQAREAGLFHPNCRHTLIAHIPGVSVTPTPSEWTAEDQARYDATQQLRALEREVRAHRRVAAAALTPFEARRANARARAVQQRIREHVARHGLNRRPRRERLDLGNR